MRGQTPERFGIGLGVAKLRGKHRSGAKQLGGGWKHIREMSLQQQGNVREHSDGMARAYVCRKGKHLPVGLNGCLASLDPFRGGEAVSDALPESVEILVRGEQAAFRLILEAGLEDRGDNCLGGAAAP